MKRDFRYIDTKYVNSNEIVLNKKFRRQVLINKIMGFFVFLLVVGLGVWGYLIYNFKEIPFEENFYEVSSDIKIGDFVLYNSERDWYDSFLFYFNLKDTNKVKITGVPYGVVEIQNKMYQLKPDEYSYKCTKKNIEQNCILNNKYIYGKILNK